MTVTIHKSLIAKAVQNHVRSATHAEAEEAAEEALQQLKAAGYEIVRTQGDEASRHFVQIHDRAEGEEC